MTHAKRCTVFLWTIRDQIVKNCCRQSCRGNYMDIFYRQQLGISSLATTKSLRGGLFASVGLRTPMSSHANARMISTKYSGMTGAQIVKSSLEEHGVRHVFGYPGGNAIHLTDAFYHGHEKSDDSVIQYIANSNECSAGFSAAGVARATGKPGIVITTSGPSVTNLITPLMDSFYDGVPMVIITGQVPTTSPGEAFQECPTIEMTKFCCKWNSRITKISQVPNVMRRAFNEAVTGRPGPVVIDFPSDLQNLVYDDEELVHEKAESSCKMENNDGRREFPDVSQENIEEICKLLVKTERPLIIAGNGCMDISQELKAFVERFRIPVCTTLLGLGLVDTKHNLSLKWAGSFGFLSANKVIQRATLIIGIGCRFDEKLVGGRGLFAPEAVRAFDKGNGGIIQVDIREAERNQKHNVQVTHFVHSYSRDFIRRLTECFEATQHDSGSWTVTSKWLKEVQRIKSLHFQKHNLDGNNITDNAVLRALDKELTKLDGDFIISTGVGVHQMVTASEITWTKPRSFLTSGGMGTMGGSLGFAIGAKLSYPDKLVISIDGDGSFNMSNNDLKTIFQYDIPIKIIVLNDSSLLMVEIAQDFMKDGKHVGVENRNCDYNKLADAYGIDNFFCSELIMLESTMMEFIQHPGPALLHVKMERVTVIPFVPSKSPLSEMKPFGLKQL